MEKKGQATYRHGRAWEARALSEGEDPLGNLLGLLKHWGKEQPATVEEMDEAIRARAVRKFRALVQAVRVKVPFLAKR